MSEPLLSLTIEGETLALHPERAVLWPARRTVIVADTHFGKSALFSRHGVAVPAGPDAHDRERLTRLVQDSRATRLIILGDFVHAPLDPASEDARDLDAWSRRLSSTGILVIAGNHDRGSAHSGIPAAMRWQSEDLLEPPFRFTHDADRGTAATGSFGPGEVGSEAVVAGGLFTLSGHIHPVVRLGDRRKPAPRVPIFWQRRHGLVLPSFGSFTGGYVVSPAEGDSVFAVGTERVVRFR
jgi:metallophosphoesterase superfamily enzyme